MRIFTTLDKRHRKCSVYWIFFFIFGAQIMAIQFDVTISCVTPHHRIVTLSTILKVNTHIFNKLQASMVLVFVRPSCGIITLITRLKGKHQIKISHTTINFMLGSKAAFAIALPYCSFYAQNACLLPVTDPNNRHRITLMFRQF